MDPIISELAEDKHPLKMILNGGKVRRYHSQGSCEAQLVQDHTWRVLAILLYLWPSSSRELIVNAIYHDVEEGLVGDVSAPVKRHPAMREVMLSLEKDAREAMQIELPSITDYEHYRLKVADYLELCLTCKYQKTAQARGEVFRRGFGYVKDYQAKLPAHDQHRIQEFIIDMENGAFDE